MGKLLLLAFPSLNSISGPYYVDESEDDYHHIVERCETAHSKCFNAVRFCPQQNLEEHGQKDEGIGFYCEEAHELEIKSDLFSAIVPH